MASYAVLHTDLVTCVITQLLLLDTKCYVLLAFLTKGRIGIHNL